MNKLLLCALLAIAILQDTIASQWIQRADFGNFGRHRAAGMAIGNKAYVGTGHLNGDGSDEWFADWWEYDPGTNAWSQKADYPGNNGNGDQDIVAISFGTVGYAGLGQLGGSDFYKFDPTQNSWTQMTSPPGGSFNNTFPFRIGDYAYFPSLYSTNFYRYDPGNDQWTQMNPAPISVPYGTPTFSAGGFGYMKNDAMLYEYKPTTDQWTIKTPFPGTYVFRPHMVEHNGYGYVVGGAQTSFFNWGTEVWRYDHLTDSWAQMEDFPGTARRWCVLLNLNNHIYYGLGTNGTNFNDWWEFMPTAGLDELNEVTITAYPNPSTDRITIEVPDVQDFKVDLTGLSGEKINSYVSINGKVTLEKSNLSSGVYIYSVQIDGEMVQSDRIIFL